MPTDITIKHLTTKNLVIKNLGLEPYETTYQAMHEYTLQRDAHTPDAIWLVEHPPIYTLGKAASLAHRLRDNGIPSYATDRGGQITYHAPGQQIMYVLFDLKRAKRQVRDAVTALETAVIQTLKQYDIDAYAKKEAPGVYIQDQKICSLGLHIQKGCTLHGLALNIDMDLTPFQDINPCGYAGLQMTQLADHCPTFDRATLNQQLTHYFIESLLPSTPNEH